MEAFPSIENILDQTNFSNFQDEIEQMTPKKQMKLSNEEYKSLQQFRMKLLAFYEDHKEAITGEYTAELEKLRKQLYQMLKEYKDEIIAIRVKHTKAQDEELGTNVLPELKQLPRRRTRPGDSLRQRIIAGDDLRKDVERLPQKFQERIKREIEKLEELKEQIKDVKDDLVINEDIISLMSSNNILILENIFRETKQKYWVGKTKDNKIVKLTIEKEKQEGQEKVDICLTFKELYGIKVAQETLGVNEIRIIYH